MARDRHWRAGRYLRAARAATRAGAGRLGMALLGRAEGAVSGDVVHDARARGGATRPAGSGVRLAAEVGGRALSLATSFLIAVGLGVEALRRLRGRCPGVAVILAEAGRAGPAGHGRSARWSRGTLPAARHGAGEARAAAAAGARGAPVPLAVRGALSLAVVRAARGGALGAESRSGCCSSPLVLYFALCWLERVPGRGAARAGPPRPGGGGSSCCPARAAAWPRVAVALSRARRAARAGLGARRVDACRRCCWARSWSRRAYARRRGRGAPRTASATCCASRWPLAVNGGAGAAQPARRAARDLRAARPARGRPLRRRPEVRGVAERGARGDRRRRHAGAHARGAARASGSRARRATAATVALLAVPAAAGLALLAPGVVGAARRRLRGRGARRCACWRPPLVALFMNTVLLHALIAAGRADALPRLTGRARRWRRRLRVRRWCRASA